MAYTPINLGDIIQQAGQIKGQQQRQQLGDLALEQQKTELANQQGIQSTLANNPNATSADFAKYGTQGLQAYGQLSESKMADLTNHLKEQYIRSGLVASSEDPVAAARQYAPEFIAHYDQVHGPGSFEKLTPEQVKQGALQMNQQSLMSLQDPQKAAQDAFEMAQSHYKQEGPGGEAARNAATIAAENQRSAAERAVQLQGQKVTMRGQDLEAARAGIPAGYERDPDKPGSLRPIAGGPHDPNAVSAGMDSRSSVMFNRVASSANEAVAALKNIAELPVTTSTGWFGGGQAPTTLMGSVKGVLAQKITSQEAQDYKTMIAGVARSLSTIETAGLAPNGSITHSMESITLNEGDSQLTKLRKLAETRQIIEKGIEPNLSNPKLAPAQRELINKIVAEVQDAIPFTQHDITKLQQSKNPKATLMDFAAGSGLPKATATPPEIAALLNKYK